MSLQRAIENIKFDARIIEINLREGKITKEEYENFQKSLPDLSAEVIEIDLDDIQEDDFE